MAVPVITPVSTDQDMTLAGGLLQMNVTGQTSVFWEKFTGPGTATFGTPTQNNSTVSFDLSGVYVLAFTATNASGLTWATIIINVFNQDVIAGPNPTLTEQNP